MSKPTAMSAAGAAVLLAASLAAGLIALGPDALVINESASLPAGLYLRERLPVARGAVVTAVPPPSARTYLASLGAPADARLLKRVAAMAGDRVCATTGGLEIGSMRIAVRSHDRRGLRLPQWSGCRRLVRGEVFLLGETPTSFDGRYFGPIPLISIGGVYRRLM